MQASNLTSMGCGVITEEAWNRRASVYRQFKPSQQQIAVVYQIGMWHQRNEKVDM